MCMYICDVCEIVTVTVSLNLTRPWHCGDGELSWVGCMYVCTCACDGWDSVNICIMLSWVVLSSGV